MSKGSRSCILLILLVMVIVGVLMVGVAITRQSNDGKPASEQVLYPELEPRGLPQN